MKRVLTFAREHIVVWLLALAVIVIVCSEPVIDDGAEVQAAAVEDAEAAAKAEVRMQRAVASMDAEAGAAP